MIIMKLIMIMRINIIYRLLLLLFIIIIRRK